MGLLWPDTTKEHGMIIQLNLPALERLLGGDSEVEIHLRHQIVENFIKHHLRSIAKEECVKVLTASFRKEMQEFISTGNEKLGHDMTQQFGYQIRLDMQRAIERILDNEIKSIITDETNSHLQYIDQRIKSALDNEVDKRVKEEIARRLKVVQEMK